MSSTITTRTQEERDALLWQARAQIDLGKLIEQYLNNNPPPPLAPHAHHMHTWADDLQTAGESHLEALAS